MTSLIAGILLPESVLTSWWFMVLATVVAFNTIVYMGLTLSKLIPLPKPLHPARVRGWLSMIGSEVDKDSAVADIPLREVPESDNSYENMRRGIARRDIPQAFALVGGFIVIFSVAAIVVMRANGIANYLFELASGMVFLGLAQILGRRNFRARTMMWTWALACMALVGILIVDSAQSNSQTPLAYTLIVMTAFAPVTLAWRPTFVAGTIMFAAVTVASVVVEGNEDIRLIVASFAALMIGATLLRLRLLALDALSDEQDKSEALATTDVLTGQLTRNGILTLLPSLAGIAERVGQDVCVMFFDVNSLQKANAQYGEAYGDDVLRSVSDAIDARVRTGDLVARWGGDEFVVVGIGDKPAADALGARIEEAVRVTGINLGRWPTTVKVGTATGNPVDTTFEQLLNTATQEAGVTPVESSIHDR